MCIDVKYKYVLSDNEVHNEISMLLERAILLLDTVFLITFVVQDINIYL